MSHASWLQTALGASQYSKDPNTRVGAVIVSDNRRVSMGWNALPPGLSDDLLQDRSLKLQAIVHAEMMALLCRGLMSVEGATLYLAATDDTGLVFGGPPCTDCMKHLMAAGISNVVTYPQKGFSKWTENLAISRGWMRLAGIELVEVDLFAEPEA